MGNTLKSISIEGFKSIRELDTLELGPLNVLIGANGAGKSNFVGFFSLLRELVERRLQIAVAKAGGADAVLYFGPKTTDRINAKFRFGNSGYEFALVPTDDNRLIFSREMTVFYRQNWYKKSLGSGHAEAAINREQGQPAPGARRTSGDYVHKAISNWVVYHFHDTGALAGMRRHGAFNDDEYFRHDGANLAAFLFRLQKTKPKAYRNIRDVVRLAAPYFDDFKLRPVSANPEFVQIEWTQVGSDYPFRSSQISDGTLRFICMATALLQPQPPATMLFDEPELGLHPYALTLLASLFKQASKSGRQVIVCTQSAALLNEFQPQDIIVVDRDGGQSTFRRLAPTDLSEWLENYGLGELWQKNIFGGRPHPETIFQPRGMHESCAPAGGPAPSRGDKS